MSYAALAGLFLLAPLVIAAVTVAVRRPGRRWWLTTVLTIAALMLLTLVFDALMITADLFRYDHSQLSGVRIGLVPVEDLAWPLAAGILLPSLWLLTTPKTEEAR